MPAHRRFNKKTKKGRTWVYILIICLCLSALLAIRFLKDREFWNGESKVTLVIQNPDRSATVSVFDPLLNEITSILIPANTELEVSGGLGVWKLGSVWQLGENEGIGGGELLSATLRRQFKFPVNAWADSKAIGLTKNNFGAVFSALGSNYRTNLKIGDKIALARFSLKVDNTKRNKIDLSDTPYLFKTKLKDGEEGYLIGRNISRNLLSVFTNTKLSQEEFQIEIRDASGNTNVAREVGELMQVLGAKVASVVKKEESNTKCIISGNSKEVVKEISILLSCEAKFVESGSFDLEIEIGKEFSKTF